MDATALVTAVLAVTSAPPLPPDAPVPPATPPVAAAPLPKPEPKKPAGPARTVSGSIRVAHRSGAITWAQRLAFHEELVTAKRAARRLPAPRAREIRGTLLIAKRLAAAGRLSGERLIPVMKAVSATTHQARFLPMPAPKQRLQTRGDGLVYEFRPSYGVQPHALGSAGRLNALALDCLHPKRPGKCNEDAVKQAATALTDLAVLDGNRLRLEYMFPFGGGQPPFSSSMAQATGTQALARAARVTKRPEDKQAATRAFRALISPSTSVRQGGRVQRFSMYSFLPRMRVLNGEIQTLVGLSDYARIAQSKQARRIVARAARSLVAELDAWDTGAWTLYNAGGREATLHYHGLAAQFAAEACERRLAKGFCGAAKRFARYTREPPRLLARVTSVTRAGRRVLIRVRASKSAGGTLVVRGPRGGTFRRAVTLGRSPVFVPFRPSRAGRYRIDIAARGVNGKLGRTTTTLKAKPKPKPKPKPKKRKKPKATPKNPRERRSARRIGVTERRSAG